MRWTVIYKQGRGQGSSVSNSQRDVGGKVLVTHDSFRYLRTSQKRVSGRVEGVGKVDQ